MEMLKFCETQIELLSEQLHHAIMQNPSNSNCLSTLSFLKKIIASYAKIICGIDFY